MRKHTFFTAGVAAVLLTGVAAAQGANNCGSAQSISGTGNFAVNTNSATTDGPNACGVLERDVWFTWTAPTTDTYELSTCASANYDTALAIYTGSCGSLNQVGCNDDVTGCPNNRSQLPFSAMAGTTYLLQVGGWNGANGTATLNIDVGSPQTGGCANPASGPDVIVGVIPNAATFGAAGGMSGYALATTSCNVGDTELNWFSQNNQHPVIGQNIYRLEDGRFEQVGMGWLKHGFFALQGTACCTCNASSSGGSRLGVGCSDPYSAGLNGSQSRLGPRFEVNPFTGDYLFPYTDQGQTGDNAYKRVQVPTSDVDPGNFPNAEYFGEAQYITPDDAAAGNGFNNVSWVPMARTGGVTQGAFQMQTVGSTRREEAAIYAWAENEVGVVINEINVPSEGQFIAASNVIDNGNGTWRYEYAIFNNNSDLSGQSFTMPIGANVNVSSVGMSFPHYHSGEPYTNIAWNSSVNSGDVTWQTASTHAQNVNANALRWGTMYSFWFTADTAPEQKTASLGLFKPGNPGAQPVILEGPSGGTVGMPIVQSFCPATPNSTGFPGQIAASNIDLVGRTMDLTAISLPPQQFGIFVTSVTEGFTPNLGGGQGTLCLAGDIGRFVGGTVFAVDLSGQASVTADLDMMPEPNQFVVVQPGETRSFQGWHRDIVGGNQSSNLTNGVRIIFP